MEWINELKALSEAPSVVTACGPVMGVLRAEGVEVALAAAFSSSQTAAFVPLARTVSVALPSVGVHQARVSMSVRGMHRCIELLAAIAESVL